jgi:hypothetical protein
MAVQPLCKFLLEKPQEIADSHACKATLYDLASKITLVAIIAICGGVLALSLGIGGATALPVGMAITMILGPIVLLPLATTLKNWANQEENKAFHVQLTADELKSIESCTEADVRQFFTSHELSLNSLPTPSLAAHCPEAPLKALLPLIASYRARMSTIVELFRRYDENFKKTEMELDHVNIAWSLLEGSLIPTILEAALILENLTKPTEQLELSYFGSFSPKSFTERQIEKIRGRPHVYVQKGERSLTVEDIISLENGPKWIRAQLA